MSAALDAALAHFKALSRRPIEVPEWGTPGVDGAVEPVTIYVDPVSVMGRKTIDDRAAGNPADRAIFTVILNARDDVGALLFKDDAATLTAFRHKVVPQVTTRIAAEILSTGNAEIPLGK